MKRRDFFQLAAGALMAGGAAGRRPGVHAQSASPGSGTSGRPMKVDIYSRHLQWLRGADEVAAAAIEMG